MTRSFAPSGARAPEAKVERRTRGNCPDAPPQEPSSTLPPPLSRAGMLPPMRRTSATSGSRHPAPLVPSFHRGGCVPCVHEHGCFEQACDWRVQGPPDACRSAAMRAHCVHGCGGQCRPLRGLECARVRFVGCVQSCVAGAQQQPRHAQQAKRVQARCSTHARAGHSDVRV